MLLERGSLLAELGGHLDRARAGIGSLLLVAGEAGAGKSALVRSFLDGLHDTDERVGGACDPLETPRPLGPLHDFAAHPNGPLGGLAVDGRSPSAIFTDVLARLRAAESPVVMVIEDVHWADDASLDFVRYLARRIELAPAVAICTYRNDEVVSGHPLHTVLGQIVSLGAVHRLVVPPLSLRAVRELAADSDVDAEGLHERSGGNPFFVTEVLAAGNDLPTSVSDAVLARVARLGRDARRVAEAVSIAPRFADVGEIRALVGADDDALDAAVSAGVLIGEGTRLRYRHELAREAVEAGLPPVRRLGLHRRMIELVEESGTADSARLAHHAIRAGDAALIAIHAPAAALDAVARGARREAVAFLGTALEHGALLGPDRTAELQLALGVQLQYLDQPEACEVPLRAAIAHYRSTGQPKLLARALGNLQASLWNQNRYDEGLAAMNEALDVLEPLGPSKELALAYYRVAHAHMLARHRDAANEFIERARAVAAAVESEPEVDWLITMMSGTIELVVGDANEGIRLLREAITAAPGLDERARLGHALGMLGSGGGEVRRYAEAIDALEQGIAHGLATDDDYEVAYERAWLARIAFERGRWDDAVRWAELVDRDTPSRRGIAVLTALTALGRVRVRRGDPGGLELLDEMAALALHHELQHGWNAVCGRAEHLWLIGEPDVALADLQPAYERALQTDSAWARGELGFWMWRLGTIDGPPPGAAAPFALHMSGRWREAAAAWSAIGCPYEEALALAEGDEPARLSALEILAGLGARPLLDRVRLGLREAGVDRPPRGPRRQTRANPAGLTARQLAVLQLMMLGLSNGEIAERLFVTTKTVEHHVSAIYSKLGVGTRAKAIARGAEVLAAATPPGSPT